MHYLVTAALPYANGPLHLGHIRSTYLPADIYSRFQRMQGNKVLYICASDEHGTPIVLEAEKHGKTPGEFAKYYHERDKKEFEQLGFSMDLFYRTSSNENKALAQHFYQRLEKNGFVYKKKVMQYYCEELKKFMPDRYIKGACPFCKAEEQYADQCEKCGKTLKPGELEKPYCVITNTKPNLKEAEHCFFKLASFREFLSGYMKNANLQEEITNYLTNWISDLQDWDISRNLNWGITIPGEKDLVFYVWFDAPIGYISSTQALTDEWEKYWKNKETRIVHFIGKDIIYHHYLFWPAMLHGVKENYSLPYAIPTRGHLTLEGKKFSKSRNWYITLEEFLSVFPADYLRFYMTSITPHSLVDANFSLAEFEEKINNDLIANYGNLISRVGKLAMDAEIKPEYLDDELLKEIEETIKKYNGFMEKFEFKEAMEISMALVKKMNKLITEKEPWKKSGKEKNAIISNAMQGTLAASILLCPFMPFSSEEALKILGYEEKTGYNAINKKMLGKVENPASRPLFKKIEKAEIEKISAMLKKRKN